MFGWGKKETAADKAAKSAADFEKAQTAQQTRVDNVDRWSLTSSKKGRQDRARAGQRDLEMRARENQQAQASSVSEAARGLGSAVSGFGKSAIRRAQTKAAGVAGRGKENLQCMRDCKKQCGEQVGSMFGGKRRRTKRRRKSRKRKTKRNTKRRRKSRKQKTKRRRRR